MAQTTEELTALTDADLVFVPLARFGELMVDHPRIAARFLLSVQLERVALMDHLTSISRAPASARVAAFLLDLEERLKPLSEVHDGSFEMKARQDQIADVVGLTSVHTNRTLRRMDRSGLISRDGARYTLADRPALTRLAARPIRHRVPDLSWIAPVDRELHGSD